MQLFTSNPSLPIPLKAITYSLCTYQLKVHQKQYRGLSWNRAMDEVRVERLVQKYKESGELDSEDPALLMLKKWPVSKQCKDNAEKLPGLEQQVNRYMFSCGK